MNIIQITPGAGGMYCGGCFRDNALVAELRRAGHHALMVPLYLPLTLDEPDQSAQTPIFFGGINVYLEQKLALFRHLPRWLLRPLESRTVLKWASGRAARTRAAEVGDLTLSMLRGEEGNQARELETLIDWLRSQEKPDLVCLSNVLLIGMARRLKEALRVPVACLLSGEDTFLDALPESVRATAWRTLAERCREVDLFLPPSAYFAELMARRLKLRLEQVRVLPDGINLNGFTVAALPPQPPVLGYFARMCPEKGLDTLVDAFVLLKQRAIGRELRLHIGGGCGPNDEPFVAEQKQKLAAAGLLEHARFFPNVDRTGKLEFFHSLTVFSAPALYGEAFGLYLLEALASGVPVVQPRHAAFPEIIEATGGGVLCKPGDAKSLADAVEQLLADPARARELGRRGREAVEQRFSIARMSENMVKEFEAVRAVRFSSRQS
jgi:glycosyltransferase involved in cell wall biosynthesis